MTNNRSLLRTIIEWVALLCVAVGIAIVVNNNWAWVMVVLLLMVASAQSFSAWNSMRRGQDGRQEGGDAKLRFPMKYIIATSFLMTLSLRSFSYGLRAAPREAWMWLIVSFVITAGITNGMLAWMVILRVAQARWAASVTRVGLAGIAGVAVPVSVLVALLANVRSYAPWASHPIQAKAAWLNVPFFVIREAVLLGVFWALCWLMMMWHSNANDKSSGGEEITGTDHHRLNVVACGAIVMYAVASSVVSYDFVMSLSPEWTSTMFAPYFFCTNLYAGMAAIILLAAWQRKRPGAEKYLGSAQFHDMGNLLLAFSLFDMGLFFAQYLTIWYGNLPEETGFIILRYYRGPWPYLGWTAFILGYAIPFVFLQSRKLKENPKMLAPVAALALLGVMLERYVLIAPSLHPTKLLAYPAGILIPIGLMGSMLAGIVMYLNSGSPVLAADEALAHMEPAEEPI